MVDKQCDNILENSKIGFMWKKFLFMFIGLLKGGFFHILTGNFMNKAISMISSIVVVRLVDKVVYADISYVDNIFSYISLASGLGMSNSLLKFCSTNQSTELDMAYVKYSLKIGGTFEFLVTLFVCILITVIDIPYPGARMFAWAFLFYPLNQFLVTTGSVYMRTQLDNKKYAYVGVASSVFLCVFSVVFVVSLGTAGIVPARYLAHILVLIYVIVYYRKRTKSKKSLKLTKHQKKDFMYMGLSMGLASFFSGIIPINESFLVNNIIGDPIVTANFRVAGLLPQMLFLISGAITVYFFPIISRMKDFREIKLKVVRVAIINFAIIICVTVLGVLFTPFVINLLYGKKYMDAVSISYLLWIMRAVNCIVRMVPINMLPAIGKVKFNLIMSIVSCVLQYVIDYYFINVVGIKGVAVGATIVYLLSGVAYWIYFVYSCNKNIKFVGAGYSECNKDGIEM